MSNSVRPHRWQPTGSSVPGILQARTLEWVSISFSNACRHAKSLQLCPTLWSHVQQPTRLLCPRNSLGKSTGGGCHFLLLWDSVNSFPSPLSWILGLSFPVCFLKNSFSYYIYSYPKHCISALCSFEFYSAVLLCDYSYMWSQHTTGRISLDRYLGVELLGHKYLHFQPSKNNARLFLEAVVPIHTPSDRVRASPNPWPSLHMEKWYCLSIKILWINWNTMVSYCGICLIRNEVKHFFKFI